MSEIRPVELSPWRTRLNECMPLFGHRNWIAVVDAAYPAQARDGIETVVTGAEQLEVVRAVWEAVAAAPHIGASVLTDAEMALVAESDAPGVTEYRNQLDGLLAGAERRGVAHEEIIGRLDGAAQLFRILILKTQMTIPYTSVFFELGCGYWTADAEARLRSAMKNPTGEGR